MARARRGFAETGVAEELLALAVARARTPNREQGGGCGVAAEGVRRADDSREPRQATPARVRDIGAGGSVEGRTLHGEGAIDSAEEGRRVSDHL